MKRDKDALYEEGQVIVIPDAVVGDRPALVTDVEGGSYGTVHYAFINGDGTTGRCGHFPAYQKGIKHVDFAKVWTQVQLPPEWKERAVEYDKRKADEKSPLDDWEPEEHPSYATVRIGRVSGHTQLFMSPFKHQHYMTLSIHRATKHRSLANDRTFSEMRDVVEVSMSEAQWARLVSSVGNGEGTPCTISRIGGEILPECPEQVEVEKFHEDTKRYMEKSAESLNDAINMAETLMGKPSVTKAERKELLGRLTAAKAHLTSGLPFVATQLRERMEHIVSDGKTEIEAFFQRQVQKLGLNRLQATPPIEFAKLPGPGKCNHGSTQPAACPTCIASGATVEFEPEEGEES
jgi:hypothetical protein